MANISLTAPTDYQTEAQAIERRRRMAELLQQQSMQPLDTNQTAGGYVVPVSWTQGLAKALQGYQGGSEMRKADQDAKALSERARGDRTADMQALAAALVPAKSPTTPNDDEGNLNPMVAGGGGITPALLAQLRTPEMQQAGFGALMSQSGPKSPIKLGKDDRLVDPNTYQPIGPQPVQQPKYHVVGGNLVAEPTAPGQMVSPAFTAPDKNADSWGEPYQLGGAMVQKNKVTGEIRQAVARPPVTNVSTNVTNSGPKAFETELGKLDAEQLGKFRTDAQAANQTLGLVQNLRSAEQQGVYSGGGAQAKTAVANLVNGLTGATPKGLVGSQIFNAETSKLVLERIKMLGANPSNADREFIEKTVPMLSTSPEARNALIGFLEQKAGQSLDLYKRADAYARKNHGLGGFNMFATPGADIHSEAEAILRGGK